MRRLLIALLVLPLGMSLGQPRACAAGGGTSAPQGSESQASGKGPLRVAVAANFRATAKLLAERFYQARGIRVLLSSASTGILAAQLRRGAPHDVLLAADRHRPQTLMLDGYAVDARCYARGSLVLLGAQTKNASMHKPMDEFLQDALANASLSVAIANPDTAPYGAAAAEVLARSPESPKRGGVAAGADRESTTRRIVRGNNVLQAYQFFRAGATDLALVARSLSPEEGIPVPAQWHSAIEQYAIISASSEQQAAARAFLDYLTGPDADTLLRERGYQRCS